jgi:signal transduction protein with GAF and PtsI domain
VRVLNPYPTQFDESAPILLKTFLQQSFLHSTTTKSNFKISFGGVTKMRVIVLRKQQEPEAGTEAILEQVPEEVRQQVADVLEEKKRVFNETGDILAEITRLIVDIDNTLTNTNRALVENFQQLKVEDLQRVRDNLEQVRNALQEAAGAVENLGVNLRKGGGA